MHNPHKAAAAASLTLSHLLSRARKSNLEVNTLNIPTTSSCVTPKIRIAPIHHPHNKVFNFPQWLQWTCKEDMLSKRWLEIQRDKLLLQV
jgi:hypothetical protein